MAALRTSSTVGTLGSGFDKRALARSSAATSEGQCQIRRKKYDDAQKHVSKKPRKDVENAFNACAWVAEKGWGTGARLRPVEILLHRPLDTIS